MISDLSVSKEALKQNRLFIIFIALFGLSILIPLRRCEAHPINNGSSLFTCSTVDAQIDLCWPLTQHLAPLQGRFTISTQDVPRIISKHRIVKNFTVQSAVQLSKTRQVSVDSYSIVELVSGLIAFSGDGPVSAFPVIVDNRSSRFRVTVPDQLIANCKENQELQCRDLLNLSALQYFEAEHLTFLIQLPPGLSPCLARTSLSPFQVDAWDYVDVVPYLNAYLS